MSFTRTSPPELQAAEVLKVKKHETGIVVDPITIEPGAPLSRVVEVMRAHGINGIPVVEGRKILVGIITSRDVRFEKNLNQPVHQVMTKKLDHRARERHARRRDRAAPQATASRSCWW